MLTLDVAKNLAGPVVTFSMGLLERVLLRVSIMLAVA